jgi:hypothetical protein
MVPAMHELFGRVRSDNMRGMQFQRQEKVIKKYLLCLVVFFIAFRAAMDFRRWSRLLPASDSCCWY